MSDFLVFFISSMLTFCIGTFYGISSVYKANDLTPSNFLGDIKYSELKQMKETCEIDLPRNKVCKADIVFIPEAVE